MALKKSHVLSLSIMLLLWPARVNALLQDEETRSKRSDDPSPLQAVIDNLVQRMTANEARMTASEAEVAALKTRLNKDETTVAFHAWSTSSDITATPYGTVIVPHAATNIGNAYDPQTGFFTAPVSGLYMFHATFMDHDHAGYSEAGIYVDGSRVATSISDSRHGFWDNPAIAAVVHVTAGQKVQLRNSENVVRYFYRGQYTTFSGFLIRAD